MKETTNYNKPNQVKFPYCNNIWIWFFGEKRISKNRFQDGDLERSTSVANKVFKERGNVQNQEKVIISKKVSKSFNVDARVFRESYV